LPKIVDHDAFRKDLIERSFDLFARKGFGILTIRDIARELGVSTGTLYHYFDSKDSIFRAMLSHLSSADVIQAVGALQGKETPQDRLTVLLDFLSERENHFQNLLLIVLDYYRYAGTENPISLTVTYYRDAISEHLGFIDARISGFLLSYMLGLLLQRLLDPGFKPEEQNELLSQVMRLMNEGGLPCSNI